MLAILATGSAFAGGCGSAREAPHSKSLALICRAIAAPTNGQRTIGLGPPGSCSSGDLAEIADLVARLRSAIANGSDVCTLLTPNSRWNAQRWGHESNSSCSQAVLKNGNVTNPRVQLSQPVGRVLLASTSTRSSPPAALVTFLPPNQRDPSTGTRFNALTVAVLKNANAEWQIRQIGYQF